MQSTPAAAPDARFEITYEQFGGTLYNSELRGQGSLLVRSAGPTYVFSGTKRETLAFSRTVEIELSPDRIANVEVTGRGVQFLVRGGGPPVPFVFFCRSAGDAAAIAALLPPARDSEFVARAEFADRLARVAGSASPWTSLTHLFIAANLLVFVLMGLAGAGWFGVAEMMPYIRFGANRADVTTDGEWWRLVTSMFLHYGATHLLFNMWALFQAGRLAEKLFGRLSYALVYFGSGIAGSLATLLWHREKLIWSAGASGAVFGVFGAILGYMLRERQALPKSVFQPLLKSTLAFAGYNLLFGLALPNIDNAAHIGGFAGGIMLGWILALPVDAGARVRLVSRRLAAGLAAMALLIAGGVLLAPRFDYRLGDEIAWQEANQAPGAKEAEVAKRGEAAFAAFAKTQERRELARWLADEAIPFYTQWRSGILALQLAPDRSTARRRTGFANILRLKIESYEHLLTALQRGSSNGMPAFRAEQQAIGKEMRKLSPR